MRRLFVCAMWAAGVLGAQDKAAPAEELSGSIELGYRFLAGPGGSLDTYRSIVNLGRGPKLVNADFSVAGPGYKVFDSLRVRATSWGDEPYSTLHVDAEFGRDVALLTKLDFHTGTASTLAAIPGSAFQQFITRWQVGKDIYYAGLENGTSLAAPLFFAGKAETIDLCSVSACFPHVITYPEPGLGGNQETGSVRNRVSSLASSKPSPR